MTQQLKYIFLIGIPGCGKSTAFRHCKAQLQRGAYYGCPIAKFDDYPDLKYLYELEQHRGFDMFTEENGTFLVKDDRAYDLALHRLSERLMDEPPTEGIHFVEFSRLQYDRAFDQFSLGVIRQSILLEVNAPVETCMDRNRARKAMVSDDPDVHYVPEFAMHRFANASRNDYGLFFQQMPFLGYRRIHNQGVEKAFTNTLDDLIETMIIPHAAQQ